MQKTASPSVYSGKTVFTEFVMTAPTLTPVQYAHFPYWKLVFGRIARRESITRLKLQVQAAPTKSRESRLSGEHRLIVILNEKAWFTTVRVNSTKMPKGFPKLLLLVN